MDTVGIHIEGERIFTARLKQQKGRVEIAALTENENPDPACKIVSGLEGGSLILRKLSFKLKSRRAILQALPFQAEGNLPYPPEETVLLPFFSKVAGGMYDVTLSATTKTSLQQHLDKMQAHHMDPDQVSCTPAALFRFARHFFSEERDLFFLHLGERESVCGLILENALEQFYAFPLGAAHFLESENASLLRLQKEIDRALVSLRKKALLSPNKLLFTGNSSLIARLKEKVESITSLTILEAPSDAAASYAVPLGLALDGLAKDASVTQFRQKEFLSSREQKRRNKFISIYLLSSIVLALVTSLSSHLLHGKEEKMLAEQLRRVASSDISTSSLEEGVSRAELALSKDKAPFPLASTAPKVCDLLAWLSTHPKFSQEIDIKEVHYQLVKHPKLGGPNEPYLAKVELKFSSATPLAARQLREALQKGDALVNAKQEITWNVHQNIYQTSFYLKRMGS